MRTEHIFVTGAASELRVRFGASKTGLSHPLAVFLMTVPKRFLCCSSLFVRLWFHM